MTLPAITNATLTAVTAAGFTPDYDETATSGTSKWSGAEEVLWVEETEEVSQGEVEQRRTRDTQDVFVHRYLVTSDSLVIDWTIGDMLTVLYEGDTRIARVRSISRTTATGLAGVVRIVLGDE